MKQRYDSYKPSDIDWIGDIPSHWKVCKLNRLLDGIQDGTHATLQRVDYGHPLLSAKNVFEDGIHISENESCISPMDFNEIISNGYPQKGDIALCCVATIGRGCIYPFDYPLAFQRSVTFLRINSHYSNSFILYYLRSVSAKAQFDTYAKTSAQSGVYMGDLKRFYISLPPLAEQEAIAAWLDTRCGEIDAAIAKVDREIELIDELKQSEISRVVTRGLNPDAPLRSSGIDWIGDIPQYWQIKRLRYVCEFRNGYTPSKANDEFWSDGTIPWYRMEDIRESGRFLKEAKQYISTEAIKGCGLFEGGSFILATTATIGEHAMLIVDSQANQRFTNLKIRKSLSHPVTKEFFFYFLFQ